MLFWRLWHLLKTWTFIGRFSEDLGEFLKTCVESISENLGDFLKTKAIFGHFFEELGDFLKTSSY